MKQLYQNIWGEPEAGGCYVRNPGQQAGQLHPRVPGTRTRRRRIIHKRRSMVVAAAWETEWKKRMNIITATWWNGRFEKMDYLVHATPNHHPSKIDVLLKTFLQILLAAKWLVRHSSMFPNYQRRPLPSLLCIINLILCRYRSKHS